MQSSENQRIALNESSLKLFEDLKEQINQLHLDENTKGSLNERISELRESNAALTASGSARELEIQAMAKQIDEVGRELTAKSEEIATLRTDPIEDPILVGKIRDLENSKIVLEDEIKIVNQEASKAKEELVSCQVTTLNTQKQAQDLQVKLTEAQTMIKTLIEDKIKYVANYKAEVEKECNKVARDAHAAKTEAKLQHDCRVKNLEQRRSEAEKELALVQGEVQKSQEERASYTSNLNQLHEEVSACKKQMAQQLGYIKHADQRIPTRDVFDLRQGELQHAIARITELKANFEVIQKETSQQIGDAVINHQNETANLLQRVDALEKESSKPVQTPCAMGPPAVTVPKSVTAQRLSSVASDCSSLQVGSNENIPCSLGMPGTPKDLLRQNEFRLSSTVHQGSNFPRATPTQTGNARSDVTPSSVQCPQVASTTVRTNSVVDKLADGSSPPYQGISRPLRVANRKSSGLSQSLHTEKYTTTIERYSVKVSGLGQPDGSSASQPPKDMAMPSYGPSSMSSGRVSSTITWPTREERPASCSSANTARHEEQSIVTQSPSDETAYKVAPQLPSSSPLSECDISSINLFGFGEEDSNKAFLEAKVPKVEDFSLKEYGGRRDSASTYQNTVDNIAAVKFNEDPTSYKFSSNDDYVGVSANRRVRPTAISAADEATRRRQSVPLKSALKKICKTQDVSGANGASTVQIPASTPPDSNSFRPTRTSTRQMAPARQNTGSSYNRIASGSKSDGSSQASAAPSTAGKQSTNNHFLGHVDKSPLQSAPARNSRKRSASLSEMKSQPTKSFKQPRMSHPNQGPRENRTVIPDSQEEYGRR